MDEYFAASVDPLECFYGRARRPLARVRAERREPDEICSGAVRAHRAGDDEVLLIDWGAWHGPGRLQVVREGGAHAGRRARVHRPVRVSELPRRRASAARYPRPVDDASVDPRWVRVALTLVVATMGYNVLEAAVALWSGVQADSIALVGFGLDSVIECVAAGALLWRLREEATGADHERIERAEQRVHLIVGGTFVALAVYVVAQAAYTLWTADAPEESVIGIVLAAASLVIMPLVAWGKLRAASAMGSAALRAEAKETLACSYLSLALLVGLAANAAAGWWWADPVAALLMVPWLVKEGLEGLRGEEDDD